MSPTDVSLHNSEQWNFREGLHVEPTNQAAVGFIVTSLCASLLRVLRYVEYLATNSNGNQALD